MRAMIREPRDAGRALRDGSRRAMLVIRDESMRAIRASEAAAKRTFQDARLKTSLAIGLVLVGFLLVAQWRGVHTSTSSLEGQSDQNLAIIISEMSTENSSMRNEILRLETQMLQADRDEKGRSDVLNQAAREIDNLRVLSGSEGARGPGVVVTISDPAGALLPQDVVNVVEELRAAGAEAIALNGVRLQATSGFGRRGHKLTVAGTDIVSPLAFMAIGDAGNLRQALELPGGLKATLSAFPEVRVTIDTRVDLEVPAASASGRKISTPSTS
jgi:uncharacterized protein YlxW (UPF0749 family)